MKFSPEGGTIEVQLNNVVLTVRDHGPGIPQDELPHVFQQAGGDVILTRAAGRGMVATVRLPGVATAPPEAP